MPISLAHFYRPNDPNETDHRIALGRYLWFRKRILPPPATLCEAGIASGQLFTAMLGDVVDWEIRADATADQIFQPHMGLEIDPKQVEICRKDLIATALIEQHDIAQLWPILSGTYTQVVLGEVLEHIPKEGWEVALSEAWRVCTHQILISCPVNGVSGAAGLRLEDRVWKDHEMEEEFGHRYLPSFANFKDLIQQFTPEAHSRWIYLHRHEYNTKLRTECGFMYAQVIKKRWW